MKLCLDVWYTKAMDDVEKRIEWQNNFKKSYDNIVKNYDGEIIVTDFYDGLAIISWEYQIEDNLYQLASKISECVEIIIPNSIFNKQKVISTLKDIDEFIFSDDDFSYTIYTRKV